MSDIKNLNIEIGTLMQLEFETVRYRLKSEFVGMVQHSYLIVTMPPSKSIPNASKIFTHGIDTIIRFVHQGTAYGFITTVERAIYKPAKLLFLKYPKSFEIYQLRNFERVLCLLPASLELSKEDAIAGHVIDISKEGCQFSTDNISFAGKNNTPAIDDERSIALQLPGFENTVFISCKVKNVCQTKTHFKIGLKFISMSDDARARLHDFLGGVGVKLGSDQEK